MKNNKGYSLVELIIAMAVFMIMFAQISAFMIFSQRLYVKDSGDVKLQTEAQQIIQQLEELLIDAQVSVAVNNQVDDMPSRVQNDPKSDPFKVKNVNVGEKFTIEWSEKDEATGKKSISYNFVLKDDMDGARYDEFGYLYMTKYTDGAPGTEQLMGEYVNNIQLDMSHFDDSSRVTISVSMNNGTREYIATKDVYLRNDIGGSMGKNNDNDDEGDIYIDVLRCKDYNLVDYTGTGFTYEWKDPTNTANSAYFTLTTAGSLKPTTTANNTNKITGNFVVTAVATSGVAADNKKIVLSFKDVMIGTDNVGFFHPVVSQESPSLRKDYIIVQGIDINAVKLSESTINFWYCNENNGGSEDNYVMKSVAITSIPKQPGIATTGTKTSNDNSIQGPCFQMKQHCMSFDTQDNLIIVYADGYNSNISSSDPIWTYYDKLSHLRTVRGTDASGNQFENIHFDLQLKFDGRADKVHAKIYAEPVCNYGYNAKRWETNFWKVTDEKVY